MRGRRAVGALFFGLVAACGSGDSGGTSEPATDPGGAKPGGPSTTSPAATTPTPAPSDLPSDPLVGLWSVKGRDVRGDYDGQVEVRPDGGAYSFIHVIHYATAKVEDERELHWVFHGKLEKSGAKVGLTSALKRVDFITARGKLVRTPTDGPVALTGSLTLGASDVKGTLTAPDISMDETWSARAALPQAPIFKDERVIVPAHPPPSGTEKTANFNLYSSYHGLDVIKPYVSRPEFQAAVHRHQIDPTDLAFYRANKNALRVVDKVIDDISLAETRVRADAYRWTFAEKAASYQKDIVTRFLDPAVGTMPHGGPVGAGYDQMWESGDGSLWTAVYLASQVYRYEVTGEKEAMDQVALTLDALLKLQEITGDWSKFARTLRKPRGEGNGWHLGTGAYSNVEWLEGGNNDMIKGLFYGYLLGWTMFCEGGKTGHESLCARIRTNSKHLADDVILTGSNAIASQQTNRHIASWLYAVVTDDMGDAFTYKAKAEGYWAAIKLAMPATAVYYSQGIVDWSGTHLTFVGDVVAMLLAQRMDIGGDSAKTYRAHIDASHKNLEKQRFPTWHLLKAAFGTGASPTSPFIADAKSRLLEAQWPKVSYTSDRRVSPDFCMSPYPAVPWKGDWMQYPNEDRTQALDSYPLFETGPSINYWMTGNDYRENEGYDSPGGDYLHLYWFARRFGLMSATE
ncbi:MAG: hypothetical protein U0235_21300 [Polyangiaceae bacterium]